MLHTMERWQSGRMRQTRYRSEEAEMNEGRKPEGQICVCGTQTDNRLRVAGSDIMLHTMERWQSGRMRQTRNLLYNLFVPRVRIPPFPPKAPEWVLFFMG